MVKNVPVSVRKRLSNLSKNEERLSLDLLQYYAMERFLYRLSKSSHVNKFILKGALFLHVFGGELSRATKDIDLLGVTKTTVEDIATILKECMRVDVINDGMKYSEDSLVISQTQWDSRDRGVRATFLATLGTSRIKMQIDIGFGSKITPEPMLITYPQLLDYGTPKLLGSTLESAIADKFEAMVSRDKTNSRLKDFYDLWVLANNRSFQSNSLAKALKETFQYYKTNIPIEAPGCLTKEFYGAQEKKTQWNGFFRQTKIEERVELEKVCELIKTFLMPICSDILEGTPSKKQWEPKKGWTKQANLKKA